MKFAKLALFATAMTIAPVAAHAQDVGAAVIGNDGAPIGTVTANEGGVVTVDTGKHSAPLPANLLAEREGQWTVNATQAQIDGMMDAQVAQAQAAADAQAAAEAEAAAKLAAALVVGNAVITADAQPLGSITELDEANVVVSNDEVGLVTLPRGFFALDAEDQLVARANLADIVAAVQGG